MKRYTCENCEEECGLINYIPEIKLWICNRCLSAYFKGRILQKQEETKMPKLAKQLMGKNVGMKKVVSGKKPVVAVKKVVKVKKGYK